MELSGSVAGIIELLGGGSKVTITPMVVDGVEIMEIKVDDNTYHIYCPDSDTVSIDPALESGTLVATFTIDGNDIEIYAPTPESPTSVSVDDLLTSGVTVATITVNDTPYVIKVPSGVGSVTVDQIVSTGTKIASITVDENTTDLYAPSGGGSIEFSTSEKEIGKWIDGKTLYSKVYPCTISVSSGSAVFTNVVSDLYSIDTFVMAFGVYNNNQRDRGTLPISLYQSAGVLYGSLANINTTIKNLCLIYTKTS